MMFERIFKKWPIDKALERQEIFISDTTRSRKSSFSTLVFHKALRGHTDQQELLVVYSVSIVFSLMTTVFSDARERANVSIFDEVRYLFVDRSDLATNTSEDSVDLS